MKKQVGSALIIVLVILVLVTLIGTLAVRSGILGLKLATNSQIQALLLENSNSALFNLEDPSQVARQLAGDGMYSYFNDSANATDELVFCYRASQAQFFSMNNASVIDQAGGITKNGVMGFCKKNQFATGRSAILSQVYLQKNSDTDEPFASAALNTSLGVTSSNLPIVSNSISATVISVLPSFASATDAQIENCFRQRASQVSSCFSNLNIPFNTQHADYIVGAQPKLKS
ncbi:pilus assembly protein PilX [Acinetobacter johnsonii]|jgi:Tfp pilus assembly protein PilX|uniref:pilus assembly protein PilX n=1 Tax=Acinetobacter johnsonii TaxID=40214 RepID=UPI00244707C4|nr:pilus assembly protein PilX [Acinetobacter johnsonii]MDH1276730.1 pilus assembly protein PilX [Acinetobacter johnsonii]MDQ8973047.1 pilus assembly protein PilX [Acinetobacter johnsonii]